MVTIQMNDGRMEVKHAEDVSALLHDDERFCDDYEMGGLGMMRPRNASRDDPTTWANFANEPFSGLWGPNRIQHAVSSRRRTCWYHCT